MAIISQQAQIVLQQSTGETAFIFQHKPSMYCLLASNQRFRTKYTALLLKASILELVSTHQHPMSTISESVL